MPKKVWFLLLSMALAASISLPVLAAPEDTEPDETAEAIEAENSRPAVAPEIVEEELPEEVAPPVAVTDYDGLLDPRTGLPYEETAYDEDADYVTLQEGVFGYDKKKRCYNNIVGYNSFSSNVPNGAVLSKGQSVSITLGSGLSGVLYCNGDVQEGADLANISQEGSYVLEVRSGGSGDQVSFSFQILGEITNALHELSLPAGFSFDYISCNGEEAGSEYANYFELWEDGAYEIRWSNAAISQYYTLTFTLDTKAPTLALPEVTDGSAHSKVTLTDLEPGCYILVEMGDGESKTIHSADEEIKEAGTYHLKVYDPAGNFTAYDFVIHVYLDLSAFAALGLLAGICLGLWLYSRHIRKHPRVG